jgi:hypothetical protein
MIAQVLGSILMALGMAVVLGLALRFGGVSQARKVVSTSIYLIGVALVVLACSTAHAGPIDFTGPPAVTPINITGGTVLPTSPPNPPDVGNPPLAAAAPLVALAPFGFDQGIRTTGTLDFVAVGGTASVSYVAIRPFDTSLPEDDRLAIFYDVASWSNLPSTTALRERYSAETFVPDIGLIGVGATVPASVPFNSAVAHPPRPLFGTTLDDTGLNFSGPLPGPPGIHELFQLVQIDFANLAPNEVIRIDALPVESGIMPIVTIPEPSSLVMAGMSILTLAGCGWWMRRRRQ